MVIEIFVEVSKKNFDLKDLNATKIEAFEIASRLGGSVVYGQGLPNGTRLVLEEK